MTALTDLLARVEKAEGADRELDADLWWVLDHAQAQHYFNTGALGLPREYPATLPAPPGLGRAGVLAMCPAYTASLDAALALLEWVLPGANWRVQGPWAAVWLPNDIPAGWIAEDCETPAFAVLAALLKALISKEKP